MLSNACPQFNTTRLNCYAPLSALSRLLLIQCTACAVLLFFLTRTMCFEVAGILQLVLSLSICAFVLYIVLSNEMGLELSCLLDFLFVC